MHQQTYWKYYTTVVSTILSVIIFNSFSYCGDCYTETFFLFNTSYIPHHPPPPPTMHPIHEVKHTHPHTMHRPMHCPGCLLTQTPIRPHLTYTSQDYMIQLLSIHLVNSFSLCSCLKAKWSTMCGLLGHLASLTVIILVTVTTIHLRQANVQGWDSPTLKLYYLSLWQSLFQWKTLLVEKTVIVELGESWPRALLHLKDFQNECLCRDQVYCNVYNEPLSRRVFTLSRT